MSTIFNFDTDLTFAFAADYNKGSSASSPVPIYQSSILWRDYEDNISKGRTSFSITSFCSSCLLSFLQLPFCYLCCHLTLEDVPLRDILNVEQSSSFCRKIDKVCRLLSSSFPPRPSPPPLQKFTDQRVSIQQHFPPMYKPQSGTP